MHAGISLAIGKLSCLLLLVAVQSAAAERSFERVRIDATIIEEVLRERR